MKPHPLDRVILFLARGLAVLTVVLGCIFLLAGLLGLIF